MFLMRCGLVVELSEGEWNELTRHPKDRGKDRPNSRTNSLQHGENDADQTEFGPLCYCARLHIGSLMLILCF
jgi:hypothetical protein